MSPVVNLIPALLAGLGAGLGVRLLCTHALLGKAQRQSKHLIQTARRRSELAAEAARRSWNESIEGKRAEFEESHADRLNNCQLRQDELAEREELAQKELETIGAVKQRLNNERSALGRSKKRILQEKERVQTIRRETRDQLLERIEWTEEKAQHELLAPFEKTLAEEADRQVEHSLKIIKSDVDRRTGRLIRSTIERCQVSHFSEPHQSVLRPSRKGRQDRHIPDEKLAELLEETLGIEITRREDGFLALLGSNGVAKEIARRSLQEEFKGRQPRLNSIRKHIDQFRSVVHSELDKTGRWTLRQCRIPSLPQAVTQVLGRLKYRTSYGQNILYHSIEVSHLCGLLATEIGLNPLLAREAGLLHDIGKALDHEQEGGHPEIGAELLRQAKRPDEVVSAASDHHFSPDQQGTYTLLVSSGDAISASRPGARRETIDLYIERLNLLESIANRERGVQTSFAIQAGRELRVLVNPNQVNDDRAAQICRSIIDQIESDLQIPGPVKITVIREQCVVEYAS